MKVEGADKLAARLKSMYTLNDVKASVRARTAEMQSIAQRKAPVDTGNLRRSIGLRIESGGLKGVVEATANYAAYVEYGTRFMNAQPFMRPALDEVAPKFESDGKRMLKK